jgi:hypothetical protein
MALVLFSGAASAQTKEQRLRNLSPEKRAEYEKFLMQMPSADKCPKGAKAALAALAARVRAGAPQRKKGGVTHETLLNPPHCSRPQRLTEPQVAVMANLPFSIDPALGPPDTIQDVELAQIHYGDAGSAINYFLIKLKSGKFLLADLTKIPAVPKVPTQPCPMNSPDEFKWSLTLKNGETCLVGVANPVLMEGKIEKCAADKILQPIRMKPGIPSCTQAINKALQYIRPRISAASYKHLVEDNWQSNSLYLYQETPNRYFYAFCLHIRAEAPTHSYLVRVEMDGLVRARKVEREAFCANAEQTQELFGF